MKRILSLSLLALTGLLSACNNGTAPDAKPTISLSATPNTLTGGGTVTLTADAKDDRGVASVTFYRGDTKLGEPDTTAPYTVTDTVASTQTGNLSYRAVVTDTAGQTAEATATVTVTAAPTPAPPQQTELALGLELSAKQLVSPGTVTVTATPNQAVTKVEFYANGRLLSTDTSAPYTATVDFTYLQNGNVTVTAKAYAADGKTAQRAEIIQVGIDAGESNDTVATATQINIGQTVEARLAGQARDVDVYRFSGKGGDRLRLRVNTQSYDGTSTLDPYVTVYMPDGKTVLDSDDDGGAGKEADLRFDLPSDGTYYVMVTSYLYFNNPDQSFDSFNNNYRLELVRR